jgi:hypothetical protein
LIFCGPHLLSVSGETWCGSYSGVACAEKNIKKSLRKENQNQLGFALVPFWHC